MISLDYTFESPKPYCAWWFHVHVTTVQPLDLIWQELKNENKNETIFELEVYVYNTPVTFKKTKAKVIIPGLNW